MNLAYYCKCGSPEKQSSMEAESWLPARDAWIRHSVEVNDAPAPHLNELAALLISAIVQS